MEARLTDKSGLRQALVVAGLVTQMALLVIVSVFVGATFDSWFGTSPLVTLSSILLGFIGSLFQVWRGFQGAQETNEPPPRDPP